MTAHASADQSTARVLVIGEALVDVVVRDDGSVDEAPGGSPANVALTLGRLGHAPKLITRLADDEHGRAIRAWLVGSNVDVVAAPASRTSTATARLDTSGSATYEFDLEWNLTGVAEGRADVVHTGSIAALLEPGAADVTEMIDRLRRDALVTYDPNIRPALLSDHGDARTRVESFVARSDLVKASDEDLRWLYPDVEPLDVARTWLQSGPSVVIVTAGAGGATAVSWAGVVAVESDRAAVVDTVGAGDTFMGALIDGLVRSSFAGAAARSGLSRIGLSELEAILEFAAIAAAVTVSRPGADPPRRAELLHRAGAPGAI